jgi:hypothetical protein
MEASHCSFWDWLSGLIDREYTLIFANRQSQLSLCQ